MSFQLNLMQIYIANRPTEPQNYCIYTHQTTKGFYIHQQVKYKHKFKKKKRNRAAKQQCLSKTGIPVQCALSAHAKDKVGHARCEKSKSEVTQWKCCSICVISEIFLWRSVLALTRILFPCLLLFKCVTCIAPFYVFTCTIFSVNSLKR